MDQPIQRASSISLGEVIAERAFTLFDTAGAARQVQVRLGRPVAVVDDAACVPGTEQSTFRCPVQITGLEVDEKIFAPFGEDPFVALQYAIHLAGDVLDAGVKRLHLTNPLEAVRERHHPGGPHFADAGRSSWIWQYDSSPDKVYGL